MRLHWLVGLLLLGTAYGADETSIRNDFLVELGKQCQRTVIPPRDLKALLTPIVQTYRAMPLDVEYLDELRLAAKRYCAVEGNRPADVIVGQ